MYVVAMPNHSGAAIFMHYAEIAAQPDVRVQFIEF
jgi:hypothetical protein